MRAHKHISPNQRKFDLNFMCAQCTLLYDFYVFFLLRIFLFGCYLTCQICIVRNRTYIMFFFIQIAIKMLCMNLNVNIVLL